MGLQPTASKTNLLLLCQRPFDPNVTTDIEEVTPEQDEKRAYGTYFHTEMQALAEGKTTSDKHALEAWYETTRWLQDDRAYGPLAITGIESPLAYSPMTGKPRKTTLYLDTHTYDLKPGEIGGTYDLLAQGKQRVVIDYKTGDWGSFHLPAENPQLLTLGVMTRADVAAIVHAPRGLPPVVYAQPFSPLGLKEHRKKLQTAMSRVGDGSLTPGPHCNRCPAKRTCPAKDGTLLKTTRALVPAASRQLTELDDPGHVHLLLAEYERLAKRARDMIRERVRAGEHIERPDGKVLQFIQKAYSNLSQATIRRALPPEKAEELIRMLRETGCIEEGEREELWAK